MVKKVLTNRSESVGVDGVRRVTNPELIFGIVGPIGVDLDGVIRGLSEQLEKVGYCPRLIHLTDKMEDTRIKAKIDVSTYYRKYRSLIAYANQFRKLAKDPAAMAGLAISEIWKTREQEIRTRQEPALGRAYIIRQFKRQEEIDLMRRVYGRKFIQVSVFGGESDRRRILIEKIKRYDASPKSDATCERQAIELIDIDYNQVDDLNGQRLSEVFHLGDVFVDGTEPGSAEETISRFVQAFFGHNGLSPTKDEYGLYTAAAAALRSIDLSRQVGAAIFSKRGEVLSLGCNEVPKSGGGTYWCDDPGKKYRDFEIGSDANQERRNEIIFDLIERLSSEGVLSSEMKALSTIQERVDSLLTRKRIKDAQIMDIIEFGRMIHAEMSAISDAARLGRPIEGSTLFCTTFPCHLCAKHIVAAGVDRVVFLEPYPKSYAQKLHGDSITFDPAQRGKVIFQPFIGISPRRYRDIFEKRKRKNASGVAQDWYEGSPAPLVEDRSSSYLENEEPAVFVVLKNLRRGSPHRRARISK